MIVEVQYQNLQYVSFGMIKMCIRQGCLPSLKQARVYMHEIQST